MTRFRPCIDLHEGCVKQIVGGTLSEQPKELKTNFVSAHGAEYFADLYKKGGHVIMLGPGNDAAATAALQVGGGITDATAAMWLERGASKVIVTSWLFVDGQFSEERAQKLCDLVGRERIVLDLSCRRRRGDGPPSWYVAINKWQTETPLSVNAETLASLARFGSEYLVHAADVEGLCSGIDRELVGVLAASPIPVTYAGGAKSADDLALVNELSGGRVDLTLGSCLDVFGGKARYEDCVQWNRQQDAAGQ